MSYNFDPPISKLLELGKPDASNWHELYDEYGFTKEHVDDLIKLATFDEPGWRDLDGEDPPDEWWGPVHAWRVLGILRAETAIIPLLDVMKQDIWEDWGWEDLPDALGLIGSAALPTLRVNLSKSAHKYEGSVSLITSIQKVGEYHKEHKDEAIAILSAQLKKAKGNDPEINGFLIAALLDLKAESELEVIKAAYETENVSLMIAGDYDDVLVDFGLKEPDPDKPKRNYLMEQIMGSENAVSSSIFSKPKSSSKSSSKATKKKKKKRKAAKAQKRKNRRK